jgi:hypothetical protein
MRKPFSKDYQPKKRRGKAKPKPLAVRLSEIVGERPEKDLKEIVDWAFKHAKGDTIITESSDGEKLTAKCVSDPRLFGMITKTITEHEAKKPSFISVPVSPEFYKSTMDKLDGIETELNS